MSSCYYTVREEVGDRVFERFTDRARRVVVLAQQESRMLNHAYIGTEHILLGLIHEGEGVAAQTLVGIGVSMEGVRAQVEKLIGVGQQSPSGHIPFTPRAKRALELSLREALRLGHNYIGTEHILLGLIHEGEGVAVQVLDKMGVELTRVRQAILRLLDSYQEAAARHRANETEEPVPARHVNPLAAEAAERAERERMRAQLPVEEDEEAYQKLNDRAKATYEVLSKAWVLVAILNDHGVEPNPVLVSQLIEWSDRRGDED